jgi:hypothetical protein
LHLLHPYIIKLNNILNQYYYTMQILVRLFSRRTIVLDVLDTYDIKYIKEIIYDREMISPNLQRLTYNGKYLENNKTLAEYKMGHETFLQLYV